MKSAKEWVKEFIEKPSLGAVHKRIEAIQRDALLHAAEIASEKGIKYHREQPQAKVLAEVFNDIRAEADKLKGEK